MNVLGFMAFFFRLSFLQVIVLLHQEDIELLFQVQPWGGAFLFQSQTVSVCLKMLFGNTPSLMPPKVTELQGLEETTGDHQAQPPLLKEVSYSGSHR